MPPKFFQPLKLVQEHWIEDVDEYIANNVDERDKKRLTVNVETFWSRVATESTWPSYHWSTDLVFRTTR